MSGRSARSEEEQARLWVESLLTAHADASPELLGDLRKLSDKYLRLLHKFEKIAKIGDHMHVQMRDLNHKVAERTAELMEARKMAALGTLVAGVAHEINTPVGTAMTVASTLQRRTMAFGETIASTALKRSTLNAFVADSREATELLVQNLTRASLLIGSFKRVAVDHNSNDVRAFSLHDYVEEVMTSLQPHLRHPPVTVRLEIPAGLDIVSYPGAFGQVITNLALNAVRHAFDGRASGTIRISATPADKERVRLCFADDGNGMDEATARQAFDPFFTTRRGQGGSGLGLHITYNLVTQTLGGTISLRSQAGVGTVFELTLPTTRPSPETRS